jgi:hypothetical protein
MFALLSFSQNENLKFNKVDYKQTQKFVYFKLDGLTSQRQASQVSELILKNKSVLKIDINFNSECMAVLTLPTTADDFKQILKGNALDYDYSTVSVKDGTEIEYPVLKGSSKADKIQYEKDMDRWNNRNINN